MGVLNRFVTVTEQGLEYEPDPRHIDLLARDLGIDMDSNSRATPGEKETYDVEKHNPDEQIEDIIQCIRAAKQTCIQVSFDDNIDVHDINALPAFKDALLHGPIGDPQPERIPEGCDKDTGLPHAQMQHIKNTISLRSIPGRNRSNILRHAVQEGSAWERPTTDILAAVSKRFRKKRIGVQKAKDIEKAKHAADLLSPEQATNFRAMAARANYLSLDRPDVSFATK